MAGLGSNMISVILILITITTTSSMASNSPPSQPIKGTYWPSWASSFPPSAIDTTLFTHVYYAFLQPNNVTYKFDILNSTALGLLNFTSTLRAKNPPVKTLFSVGGASEDPITFARMASCSEPRKRFIDSSIEVARKFGFDGIDLDWEHPKSRKEMEDFGYLLEEWRAEVEKEANTTGRTPLLLTAATYFASNFFLSDVPRSYPMDSVSKNLDWVNAMSYDYHGSWEPTITGAHAALFDPKSNVTTSYGLRSWLDAGLPPNKLILGLPLYGKTWQLANSTSSGVGAPAVGVGPGDQGTLNYDEVEEFNRKNNATVVYDVDTVSTYSFAGTSWIGYDDVRSAMVKLGYAQALGLRGYFFWAVNGDYEWKISKEAAKRWII